MIRGIDHLVIAVADPDAAAAELEAAVGLRAAGGGRHESMGTYNRLIWLGDAYVELIGVFDAALAEASWVGRPTLRALGQGGGLATYALASDDLSADVARLRAAGSRLEGPFPGERIRPDGRVVRWLLAAPPTLGPTEPAFLIEHDGAAAEWSEAERVARAGEHHPVGGPVRLERLEIPVPAVHPAVMAQLRTLGLQFRPSLAGRGARDTSIGGQILRLRPGGPPDAVPAVHLRVLAAADPARVAAVPDPASGTTAAREPIEALGCRWMISR
ncbi:MAG TPA: VOC family protein [Candidatus Limnocylindrales bacterium]|nr:VOC family protein [Candidatus Limnocylindrales bacterium]